MNRQRRYKLIGLAIGLVLFGAALPVNAQTVTPFQMVGHIQNFILDSTVCPPLPPAFQKFIGARMTINGINVVIPCNTVILMPAAYLTPSQIFQGPTLSGPVKTESGLALDDTVKPLAAFEVSVDGNIVGGAYVAGQVHISQQSLNMSAGFIRRINYTTGELCVGALSTSVATCAAPDTRVRINDPSGTYGLADGPAKTSPDERFSVDTDNPTIHALTGYPMCVPRQDPTISVDPLCPSTNRSRAAGLTTFVMTGPDLPGTPGFVEIKACNPACDPAKQVPFIVGDYINFQGTLAKDVAGIYMSAHTVVANIGIYTAPGANLAYVTLDESLLGTKGNIVLCGSTAECQDRIKIEGFTTDPTRTVSIYAVDVVPGGQPTVRKLNSTAKNQAVLGRFRYVTGKNAGVVFDSSANFKGLTRELMARIEDVGSSLADGSLVPDPPKVANGLKAGIYRAPVAEYIFPEPTGVQGGTMPALNFQCLAFLVNGWALPDDGLPNIPPLNPWPGATPPAFSCTN